jgi:hypothetical protein
MTQLFRVYPPSPLFFATAHSAGLTGSVSVSADSKGVICTKMVQEFGALELRILKDLLCAQRMGPVRVSLPAAGKLCPYKKGKSGRLAAAWACIYTIWSITNSISIVKEKMKGRPAQLSGQISSFISTRAAHFGNWKEVLAFFSSWN